MRLIAIGSSVLFSACLHNAPRAERGTVVIDHPLDSGADGQHAAIIRDRGAEHFYGLPEGSLDNQAAIASASPQEVCVRVELHRGVNPALPNDHELAALGAWQLALRGNGKTSGQYRVGAPTLSVTPYDGQTTSAEHVGTTLECQSFDQHGQCTDVAWIRHWQVDREAARFEITSGTSQACFANAGVLAASSSSLELELTAPGASDPAMVFEWQFARTR